MNTQPEPEYSNADIMLMLQTIEKRIKKVNQVAWSILLTLFGAAIGVWWGLS